MPTIESIRATLAKGRQDGASRKDAAGHKIVPTAEVPVLSGRQSKILAQNRLDDARFWLAAIADSSDDAIIGRDMDGLVTSWNKAAETMFGYTANETIGEPITRIIPADRMDEEVSILKMVGRSEKIVNFETKRLCKDGRTISVSMTVLPIRDDAGKMIGVSKTARDLTETQRIHRDLERRQALLRSILDTVPDALIVIDKQGFIHSFSVAAVHMFGYYSQEMMGQNVSRLLPSTDWASHNSHMAGYAATGDRHIIGFGQRKDGSTFPMELAIGDVATPGSRLFTAFVHDLTEQAAREHAMRAANIELERLARHLETARDVADRSNWAKSRFLAGMSNELRVPVNGIVGNAQMLRAEAGLNAVQSGRVDAMLAAGLHVLQMITCVHDLSDIEADHVNQDAEECDALVVAAACVDLFRPAAEAKGLALSLAVASRLKREIVTDPARLRQVLLNLLGNAVKVTDHGSVEMRLREVASGSVLRIEVADTGPGIPAEERRRLFRDFDRLDLQATPTIAPVELDLALSARVAASLGGCLGHHDNAGGGSVFWLELPLDTATVPVPTVALAVDGVPPAQAALNILVVDDIAMNRDIAGSFLRAAGHKVACVDGGAEALAAVKALDFNVVLMDVRMPEMDGLEATRRIRAIGGKRGRVPIVALTARAFPEQVEECREAGMDSHLPKPFDPDSLLEAVLRANAAGRTHGENFGPATMLATPSVSLVVPVIGSELVILNPSSFERTAFHLTPAAVASYLDAIAERGETLLRGLRGPEALVQSGGELAEAAHALAGSAGLFGFERLTSVGRRFERAVLADAADAPALAEGLTAALEVSLHAIHDRISTTVDA